MTDANFVWDPDHDQTYDLPQDIELTDVGNLGFSKVNGSSFTLRSNATFTLKSNAETTWGWFEAQHPHTKIHVREGRFVLKDNGALDIPSTELLLEGAELVVDNDASFLVEAKSAFVSATASNQVGGIALSMAGRYDADCLFQVFNTLMITIDDVASMHIDAQLIACSETTIRNTSSADESLFLKSTSGPASKRLMYFSESTILCGAKSKSVIASALAADDAKDSTIEFLNTTVEVTEQADLHIKADTPSVDAQCRFHIGPGSPTLRFTAYTDGHSPFDFTRHSYPAAIFDFAKAGGGENKGQLMIETGASAFQFSAMMEQGAVTINGQPANPRDLTWKPLRFDGVDYFVVALEDKPR